MKRRSEIKLTEAERDAFLAQPIACTLAAVGPEGYPQLTAMWYARIDGRFHFATYAKSQKVKNFERDPKCSVLVEDGTNYAELRGYSVEGNAQLLSDPELAFQVMCEISKRYTRIDPVAAGPMVEAQIRARAQKRVVVRIDPVREISWDHRKLGGSY